MLPYILVPGVVCGIYVQNLLAWLRVLPYLPKCSSRRSNLSNGFSSLMEVPGGTRRVKEASPLVCHRYFKIGQRSSNRVIGAFEESH